MILIVSAQTLAIGHEQFGGSTRERERDLEWEKESEKNV